MKAEDDGMKMDMSGMKDMSDMKGMDMSGMKDNMEMDMAMQGEMSMQGMQRPYWQSVALSALHCGAGCTLANPIPPSRLTGTRGLEFSQRNVNCLLCTEKYK